MVLTQAHGINLFKHKSGKIMNILFLWVKALCLHTQKF